MSKYEMKDNSGSFFHETKVTVPRKGKFKLNGKLRYGAILKYTDKDDNAKYELVQSLGLIHYNKPEDKRHEKTPDIGGKITIIDTWQVFKFGGYANETSDGVPYTSAKFTPYDEDGNLIIPKKEDDEPAF